MTLCHPKQGSLKPFLITVLLLAGLCGCSSIVNIFGPEWHGALAKRGIGDLLDVKLPAEATDYHMLKSENGAHWRFWARFDANPEVIKDWLAMDGNKFDPEFGRKLRFKQPVPWQTWWGLEGAVQVSADLIIQADLSRATKRTYIVIDESHADTWSVYIHIVYQE